MEIDELIAEYRAHGDAGFRARHPTPVLVYRGNGDDEHGAAFHTAYVPRASLQARASADDDGVQVVAIAKRPGGPFEDRIGLGRARNADVHLALPQLSKYHAYFVVDGGGQYAIADAGSKNGTSVDGRALAPRQPVPLADGAEIQLGPYFFEFYSSGGLAEMIARRAR